MLNKKLSMLAVCAVMTIGCDAQPDMFVLSGDWSAEETAAFKASLDAWCDRSDGEYCGHIGDATWYDDDMHSTVSWDAPDADLAGKWWPGTEGCDTIKIRPNRDRADWLTFVARVALHELGHHFRDDPGHLPCGAGNVMSPSVDGYVLTDADLTAPLKKSIHCK